MALKRCAKYTYQNNKKIYFEILSCLPIQQLLKKVIRTQRGFNKQMQTQIKTIFVPVTSQQTASLYGTVTIVPLYR